MEIESRDNSEFGCEDCRGYMEALRHAEQRCRKAEDALATPASLAGNSALRCLHQEQEYCERIKRLEEERDSALEFLLRHQRISHS